MGISENYVRASLALSMIPSIGGGRIRRLFDHFQDPMAVFSADWAELAGVPTIGAQIAKLIRDYTSWDDVDRVLMMTKKHRMTLLTPYDSCFPPRLLHIYDPPAVLWVRGDSEALKMDFLAIVGTRRPSSDGREITVRLARQLIHKAQAGIVSGLAHGVDALAHMEALKHNRCTVAVMACGLDRIYPTGNRSLAYRIVDSGGALISEYPPGTRPEAHHFPIRNRIVSGMSHGVLVTETGIKGGSMITVGTALDQGREVFAVPHSLSNERGEGCNRIIQRGWGKLVCTAEDILVELPPEMRLTPDRGENQSPGNGCPDKVSQILQSTDADPTESLVLRLILEKERHIDEIARISGIEIHVLLAIMLRLELDGIIVQKPGKNFRVVPW